MMFPLNYKKFPICSMIFLLSSVKFPPYSMTGPSKTFSSQVRFKSLEMFIKQLWKNPAGKSFKFALGHLNFNNYPPHWKIWKIQGHLKLHWNFGNSIKKLEIPSKNLKITLKFFEISSNYLENSIKKKDFFLTSNAQSQVIWPWHIGISPCCMKFPSSPTKSPLWSSKFPSCSLKFL